jgi:hypothetical protein
MPSQDELKRFWSQFTPEEKKRLNANPQFQKFISNGDIIGAHNWALSLIQPHILDRKKAAQYRRMLRLKNELGKL